MAVQHGRPTPSSDVKGSFLYQKHNSCEFQVNIHERKYIYDIYIKLLPIGYIIYTEPVLQDYITYRLKKSPSL